MTLERILLASIAAVLVVAGFLAFRSPERPPEAKKMPRPPSMIADSERELFGSSRLLLEQGEWWAIAGRTHVLVVMGPRDAGHAAMETPDGAVHVYRVRRLVAWPPRPGLFSLMLRGEGDARDGEWEARLPGPDERKPGTVYVTAVRGSLRLDPFTVLRSETHPPAPRDAACFGQLREYLAARAK